MTPQLDRDLRWGAIMERAQRGDNQHYETLLREIFKVLNAYFERHSVEAALAEDLTQETILAIHRARHTYLPGRSFQAWMYAIARNKFVDSLRSRKIASSMSLSLENGAVEEIEAPTPMSGMGTLRAALEKLSGKQRNVLSLLKFDGLSVRIVAAQLGISESDVKVTAHRAQKALREALGS